MVKRFVAACCWFVTVTWAYNYLGYYLGLPFLGGPVLAALVSTLVWLDPLRMVWRRAASKAHPEQGAPEAKPAGLLITT
jgi:hypothetical protein